MKHLYDGIRHFSKIDFPLMRDLFSSLKSVQNPSAVFITCSDSRIDPNLITKSPPGELFVLRSPGNVVSPYDPDGPGCPAAAAIEFALQTLKINDIIVCGHSDCGALQTLATRGGTLARMPALGKWLSSTGEVLLSGNKAATVPELTRKHIVNQLKNLRTHPLVAERSPSLHGWYYDIGMGRVETYDETTGGFNPVT